MVEAATKIENLGDRGMAGAGDERLKSAAQAVEALYTFRDTFTEHHSGDEVAGKKQQVERRLQDVLKVVQELEGLGFNKGELLLLRGRALNVTSEYRPDAEHALGLAVKLEPRRPDAWNELGQTCWKKGDMDAAKDCFVSALSHERNKVSLRGLSMVLRQLPVVGESRRNNVQQSVTYAKEAVEMDLNDGVSWYVLGNANFILFFIEGQNPKFLRLALCAYTQAEKVDKRSSQNPDLHLNRAVLLCYEQRYADALADLERAQALDPEFSNSLAQKQHLLHFLNRLTELVTCKGGLIPRRLAAYSRAVQQEESKAKGRGQSRLVPLSGLNPGKNPNCQLLGKVVFYLNAQEELPIVLGLLDSEGECVTIAVYNASPTWAVFLGDSVLVQNPQFTKHNVEHEGKVFSFPCIRVDSPLLLLINGKKQCAQQQVVTTATSVSKQE
uniref:tetratricopeptide repeat protein 5-like isoform X1 n=1 Tax=Myxine glutinosa TaxID=7769 RepID=UPI00358EFBA0